MKRCIFYSSDVCWPPLQVEKIFAAISECQTLYPDPDDSDSEEEEEEEEEEGLEEIDEGVSWLWYSSSVMVFAVHS